MPAPVWFGTRKIGYCVDGGTALEARLKNMGAPLLITPKVREELLSGNSCNGRQSTRRAVRAGQV
jgi:hypothetical protein